MVAGRPIRRRSVARGTSSYQLCFSNQLFARIAEDTYIPFVFELLKIPKFSFHSLVLQDRLVLLEQTVADIGIFVLGDGVFGVVFLEAV